MDEFVAQAAAHWWADQMTGAPSHNIGADNELLLYALRRIPPLPKEHIEQFEFVLTRMIQEQSPEHISVDYSPDDILTDAATEATISASGLYFPINTHMWIYPDHVDVAKEYGAKNTIYKTPHENEIKLEGTTSEKERN